MRNPFLEFDMNYGRPFSPRRTSATAEGLFMDDDVGLMPLPHHPLATPFETPVQPLPAPIRNSYDAEGLFMEPEERERLFNSPIADPSLSALVMMALLRNLDKKRRSEGTIKKEEKPKKGGKNEKEDKEK